GGLCVCVNVFQMIEPVDVFWKCNKGYLATVHSLPNGDILIANMGDPAGNGKGGDAIGERGRAGFSPNGPSAASALATGRALPSPAPPYSSAVSRPILASRCRGCACPERSGEGLVSVGVYGRRLNFWNLSCHTLSQCFDLGEDSLPLNVRFLHNPDAAEGYVSCALSGVTYRFCKCEASCWEVEEVIRIPPINVCGWIMPKMPAFTTDIIISMDDRFLYLSNWLHGDIRQYELSKTCKPRLVGQVFVGGLLTRCGSVSVCRDEELKCQPEPLVVKCKRVYGGPCKMQLSLDGKRLYVTNSLYSTWDKEFYPCVVR
ncbi:SBP1 oxidase, partial [Ciccaba nigrolineata]|nr:SBP1 oxidase [Ciccaba nigrolineata]